MPKSVKSGRILKHSSSDTDPKSRAPYKKVRRLSMGSTGRDVLEAADYKAGQDKLKSLITPAAQAALLSVSKDLHDDDPLEMEVNAAPRSGSAQSGSSGTPDIDHRRTFHIAPKNPIPPRRETDEDDDSSSSGSGGKRVACSTRENEVSLTISTAGKGFTDVQVGTVYGMFIQLVSFLVPESASVSQSEGTITIKKKMGASALPAPHHSSTAGSPTGPFRNLTVSEKPSCSSSVKYTEPVETRDNRPALNSDEVVTVLVNTWAGKMERIDVTRDEGASAKECLIAKFRKAGKAGWASQRYNYATARYAQVGE